MTSSSMHLSCRKFTSQMQEVWDDALKEGIVHHSFTVDNAERSLDPRDREACHRLQRQKSMERTNRIREAFKLYTHAFDGPLPCIILGDETLRVSTVELRNFGILSDKPFTPPRKRKGVAELHEGAILSEKEWSVLKNDAVLLGCVHACKTVYVYTEKVKLEKLVWDSEGDFLRLTGREIAILTAAGYAQVATPEQVKKCGATFVCLDKEKARNFTLTEALAAPHQITSKEQILALL